MPVQPKILVVIPHFFGQHAHAEQYNFGSYDPGRRPERTRTFQRCLIALAAFGASSHRLDNSAEIGDRIVSAPPRCAVDIRILCTSPEKSLLSVIDLPQGARAEETDCPPEFLAFAARERLAEGIGSYDWFCYVEDDIVIQDPSFFRKLRWFGANFGGERVLLPNRYETMKWHKVYVDGEPSQFSADVWRYEKRPELSGDYLGEPIAFVHPVNPMCGCFFLDAAQMQRWAGSPDFADRTTEFFHPIEAAHFLSLRKAFDLYKPAFANADFCEVMHAAPRLSRGFKVAQRLMEEIPMRLNYFSTSGYLRFACSACAHPLKVPVQELAERYGADFPVHDIIKDRSCPQCGGGAGFSVTFLR